MDFEQRWAILVLEGFLHVLLIFFCSNAPDLDKRVITELLHNLKR